MLQRLIILWLCFAPLVMSSSRTRADDALLGHWTFDERQGDVALDHSGHQNDGDIWGAEWVEGSFGTALKFDGRGARVSVPEIAGLDGSEELTVAAWVYWEGTGKYPNIVTGGVWSPGGFLLFVSDQQCSFRMGRPGFSAAQQRDQWRETSAPLLSAFQSKTWYHIVATFQRPLITTYVNGRQVGSADWDFPVGYQGNLLIGTWSGDNGHRGLIDDVRIYSRALTPEQVAVQFRENAQGRTDRPADTAPYKIIPRTSQLAQAAALIENEVAKLAISPRGRCLALLDKRTGDDHLLRTTPFVSLGSGSKTFDRSTCSQASGKLVFRFDQAPATVVLGVDVKPRYFVFRVESVDNPDIDELTFASLNLQACKYVNDMSGLGADDEFSVCLRALNLQTAVEVRGNPPKMSASADRTHSLCGAAVALTACPNEQLRPALQDLLRQENLAYSHLGGPFAREAAENRSSYLFAYVSENDVEQWIDLAQRGGIGYIHLISWEQSLGHYAPNPSLFPNGINGLKTVVDKIHAAGLQVGMHTLTGCIDTNDPWVRPVPDPRLATDGTYTLTTAMGLQDANVPTAEPPGDFPTIWAYGSRGNCLRIDDELILYARISQAAPYGFYQCQRGAFGTHVSEHQVGAKVHHMYVRYGCFQPDENSTLVD